MFTNCACAALKRHSINRMKGFRDAIMARRTLVRGPLLPRGRFGWRECSGPMLWANARRARCVEGFTPTEDRLSCEDLDECLEEPCGHAGHCENLPDGQGHTCLCRESLHCHNCSCFDVGAGARMTNTSLALGLEALLIILACLGVYLRKGKGPLEWNPASCFVGPLNCSAFPQ